MHCLDNWKHWLLHRVVDPVQSFIKKFDRSPCLKLSIASACSPLKGLWWEWAHPEDPQSCQESSSMWKSLVIFSASFQSKPIASITFFDFAAFLPWSPRVNSVIDLAKIFFLVSKHESLNLKFSSARPLSLRSAPMRQFCWPSDHGIGTHFATSHNFHMIHYLFGFLFQMGKELNTLMSWFDLLVWSGSFFPPPFLPPPPIFLSFWGPNVQKAPPVNNAMTQSCLPIGNLYLEDHPS